jgi:predicted ester cyclase
MEKEEEAIVSIADIASRFFQASETGKGWEGCEAYCHADATFSAQAEPLAGVQTLQQYTEWMKALLGFIPDGRYELKAFATDEERRSVCAYGVFLGTHSGQGGPCPPTGKSVETDYVVLRSPARFVDACRYAFRLTGSPGRNPRHSGILASWRYPFSLRHGFLSARVFLMNAFFFA